MKTRNTLKSLSVSGALFLTLAGMAHAAQTSGSPQGAKAIFAGGCFWSVELVFDKVEGVFSTVSGYTGGTKKNPTYEEVVTGTTGHAESVQITYDPKKVSYEKLLEVFWRNIDPLTPNAQFCDVGSQYRTAIFYHDETEKRLAEKSRKALQGRFKQPIATQIVPASQFYPAEDYHQDFHLKNPLRYQFYRAGCGRDQRLKKLWETEKK
ncbi:MAG: peptide-methionine (S)-S-oxide reductase MsrA [Candidatus Binatia bacterium]